MEKKEKRKKKKLKTKEKEKRKKEKRENSKEKVYQRNQNHTLIVVLKFPETNAVGSKQAKVCPIILARRTNHKFRSSNCDLCLISPYK